MSHDSKSKMACLCPLLRVTLKPRNESGKVLDYEVKLLQNRSMNNDELYRMLLGQASPKRSVFVSFHHGGDRAYYDAFSQLFADTYDVVQDNSVEREIDSDDSQYVIQKIRDDYITGSSCTVVLCGADTPNRKFVDWEIKATLEKEHGLIGLNLPTNPLLTNGNVAAQIGFLTIFNQDTRFGQTGIVLRKIPRHWRTLSNKPTPKASFSFETTASCAQGMGKTLLTSFTSDVRSPKFV